MAETTNRVRYVAFLRGINVGGRHAIKMDALRECVSSLGFEGVKTILASGNLLFESAPESEAALGQTIENKLTETFGYRIGTIVRSLTHIQQIVDADPFAGIPVTADTRLYVSFLAEPPAAELAVPYETEAKDFRILSVCGAEVYGVFTLNPARDNIQNMDLPEKRFGKEITTRNWNTVCKLLK